MELSHLRDVRILDFDVEVRPMAFYGGDFVTKQPTAIAWKFIGEKGKPEHAFIGGSKNPDNVFDEEIQMLSKFREAYNQADIVTGHYIRGFDLPVLNARMMRHKLDMLSPKECQDTKNDLARGHGVSKSQENLGAMFEQRHPKVPMNTTSWEEANCLTTSGIELTRKRVVGDVSQHIELRGIMLAYSYLDAPSNWSPHGNGKEALYVP